MSSSREDFSSVSKLKGARNYQIWKARIKGILSENDLRVYVDGTYDIDGLLKSGLVPLSDEESLVESKGLYSSSSTEEKEQSTTLKEKERKLKLSDFRIPTSTKVTVHQVIQQDQKALSILMRHISDDIIHLILDAPTARKAWLALERQYENKEPRNLLYMLDQLSNLRLQEALLEKP